LLKKKKQEIDSKNKPQGTILNPWRVLHGIQSIIVKKSAEEEVQSVRCSLILQESMIKNETLDMIMYYLSNLNLSVDLGSEILSIIVKE